MSKTYNRFSKLLCQRLGTGCFLMLLLTGLASKEQLNSQAERRKASEALIQRFAAHLVEMSKGPLLLSVRAHPASLALQYCEQYREVPECVWGWIEDELLDDPREVHLGRFVCYGPDIELLRFSPAEIFVWLIQAFIAMIGIPVLMTARLVDRLDSVNIESF